MWPMISKCKKIDVIITPYVISFYPQDADYFDDFIKALVCIDFFRYTLGEMPRLITRNDTDHDKLHTNQLSTLLSHSHCSFKNKLTKEKVEKILKVLVVYDFIDEGEKKNFLTNYETALEKDAFIDNKKIQIPVIFFNSKNSKNKQQTNETGAFSLFTSFCG
jgi:hypothetical protein